MGTRGRRYTCRDEAYDGNSTLENTPDTVCLIAIEFMLDQGQKLGAVREMRMALVSR